MIKHDSIRKKIISLMLIAILALLAYKIIFIHTNETNNDKTLKEKGYDQTIGTVILRGYRGKIIDKYSIPLAVELPLNDIIIDPSLLQKPFYSHVAKVLNISENELEKKIKTSPSKKYLAIKKNLEINSPIIKKLKETISKYYKIEKNGKVKKEKIHGVSLKYSSKRYYSQAETTAPLLGLTDSNLNGIEGIERIYQNVLKGSNGKKKVAFDSKRKEPFSDIKVIKPAIQGKDLALTIDSSIQYFSYVALKNAVIKHNADSGSAIVLSNQGDILALVNYPTINPNNRKKYKPEYYRNYAIADIFDIGSTIKPFIAMLAMQENKISIDEIVDVSRPIKIGSKVLKTTKDKKLSVSEILQKSHNIGMVKIAGKIEKKKMWQILDTLGFGKVTKILPGSENDGKLHHYINWTSADKKSLAYGYGIDATLVQLAKSYLIFANKGKVIDLSIIKDNKNKKNSFQVFKPEIVKNTIPILKSVVENGTGKLAKINNISIAGKTGTVQIYKNGKYYSDKHRAFFVGFTPAEDAKYIMAIAIENPKTGGYEGGKVAAPVFKQTIEDILKFNYRLAEL